MVFAVKAVDMYMKPFTVRAKLQPSGSFGVCYLSLDKVWPVVRPVFSISPQLPVKGEVGKFINDMISVGVGATETIIAGRFIDFISAATILGIGKSNPVKDDECEPDPFPQTAADLSPLIAFWEQSAFYCPATAKPYPSKFEETDSQKCDDGDMTLFNGLLCAADDARGCDGVQRSQGNGGRWWRSPRREGWEWPKYDVSFSPDQSQGILHYVIKSKDKDAFLKWLTWMEDKRPCLLEIGNRCIQKGWLRFCTDDHDKRCTLRPQNCAMIEAVGRHVGVNADICRRVMKELKIPEEIILPADQFILGAVYLNDKGFPLHLAASNLLQMKNMGLSSPLLDQAAKHLVTREQDNPFFVYLRDGSTEEIKKLLAELCPNSTRPSIKRNQWTWERDDLPTTAKDSMYWECIFVSKLLK